MMQGGTKLSDYMSCYQFPTTLSCEVGGGGDGHKVAVCQLGESWIGASGQA